MPLEKDFLKKVLEFLQGKAVFTSFPLSLLLIGLEKLIEVEYFLCPCNEQNVLLTVSIFIGPAFLIFALLFLLLRPFKHKCCSCCPEPNDTQQNCPKAFASCLIPPVMWILILLIDGQYAACGMTYWKGDYVRDEELKKFWCKPTEEIEHETKLRDLTRTFIVRSQCLGYFLIFVFSVLVIVFVGFYDFCKKCWRRTEGEMEGGDIPLQPVPQR